MARSAVLAGRTFADVVTNAFALVVMLVVGFDRRLPLRRATPARSSLGIGLLLLFGYAFSWIFALIGLSRQLARGRRSRSASS